MIEPVLQQVQQPSKVTCLLSEVEVQQLDTYDTPPIHERDTNKKSLTMNRTYLKRRGANSRKERRQVNHSCAVPSDS